jgi:tetratricopeptide (TPR) repeat protein
MKRAELRRQNGNRAGAMDDYTAAIDLKPVRQVLAALYWRRARIGRELNNHDGVIRDISEAIRNGLDEPEQHLWRANAYFSRRDYSNADRDYSAHLENAAEDGAVYLRRAWSRRYLSRFVEAIADIEKCLALGDNGTNLHWMVLISSQMHLGELDKALAQSNTLVEAPANKLTGLKFRGLVLRARKEWDAAIRDYDEILTISKDPIDRLWSYFGRAAALREASKPAEALASIENAIAIGADAADDALYPLACAVALRALLRDAEAERKSDMDQAFAYLKSAVERGKTFPERMKLDFDAFALRTDARFSTFLQ